MRKTIIEEDLRNMVLSQYPCVIEKLELRRVVFNQDVEAKSRDIRHFYSRKFELGEGYVLFQVWRKGLPPVFLDWEAEEVYHILPRDYTSNAYYEYNAKNGTQYLWLEVIKGQKMLILRNAMSKDMVSRYCTYYLNMKLRCVQLTFEAEGFPKQQVWGCYQPGKDGGKDPRNLVAIYFPITGNVLKCEYIDGQLAYRASRMLEHFLGLRIFPGSAQRYVKTLVVAKDYEPDGLPLVEIKDKKGNWHKVGQWRLHGGMAYEFFKLSVPFRGSFRVKLAHEPISGTLLWMATDKEGKYICHFNLLDVFPDVYFQKSNKVKEVGLGVNSLVFNFYYTGRSIDFKKECIR